MTTQTYRRARHSVSLLHAHLVFVTSYRRPVFTDAMLTNCQNTMPSVCDDLGAGLIEFNGEADHLHLLVAYPPTLAISQLVQRLKGPLPLTPCAASTPAPVPAPACAATSGRRPTSPSPAEAHHCRSSSKTSTAKPAHSERRASPTDTGMGSPRTEVQGLRPRCRSTATLVVGEVFALLGLVCWLIVSSRSWLPIGEQP
jgi:Transposase IS200 like